MCSMKGCWDPKSNPNAISEVRSYVTCTPVACMWNCAWNGPCGFLACWQRVANRHDWMPAQTRFHPQRCCIYARHLERAIQTFHNLLKLISAGFSLALLPQGTRPNINGWFQLPGFQWWQAVTPHAATVLGTRRSLSDLLLAVYFVPSSKHSAFAEPILSFSLSNKIVFPMLRAIIASKRTWRLITGSSFWAIMWPHHVNNFKQLYK